MFNIFNKLSVSAKSYIVLFGATFMLILSIFIGFFIFSNLKHSISEVENIDKKILFNNSIITAHLNFIIKVENSILENKKIKMVKDHTNCKLGTWYYKFKNSQDFKSLPKELQDSFYSFEKPHERLHKLAKDYLANYVYKQTDLKRIILEKKIDHMKWKDKIIQSIQDRTVADVETDATKCKLGKWYYKFIVSNDFKYESLKTQDLLLSFEKIHFDLHLSAKELIKRQKARKFKTINQVFENTTKKDLDKLLNIFDNIVLELNRVDISNTEYRNLFVKEAPKLFSSIKSTLLKYNKYLEQQKKHIDKKNKELEDLITLVFIIVSICAIFGLIFGIFVNKDIDKVISNSVRSIGHKVDEITDNSTTVDITSKDLSKLSLEQAVQIKETTHLIQTVIDDIFKNSKSLQNLEQVATDVNIKVNSGYNVLKELSSAMDGINQSSSEVSAIIKTIDEISFQTNLLSLNAAVEAARAGEHGLGFAVVAEEVRSLASNSANSSKQISNIIDTSVAKTTQTVDITNSVNSSFKEILDTMEETKDMIVSINKLSQQQNNSLSKVTTSLSNTNEAIVQIEKLAHNLASTSEELNKKTLDIDKYIKSLLRN
jgi:methyl-accepting chemotaxis protein